MTTAETTGTTGRNRIERYNATEIEPRWQERWAAAAAYDTDLNDGRRRRYYLLTMYPYPSGDLHIGHWYIKRTAALINLRKVVGEMPTWPFQDTVAFGRAVLIASAPVIYAALNGLVDALFVQRIAP